MPPISDVLYFTLLHGHLAAMDAIGKERYNGLVQNAYYIDGICEDLDTGNPSRPFVRPASRRSTLHAIVLPYEGYHEQGCPPFHHFQ